MVVVGLVGCVTVDIPEEVSLLSTGEAFVISGTAALENVEGQPCLVWVADNGLTYHLFQHPALENATFDRVTTPGVRSRLELATRNDLDVNCLIGTIVEVQDVLEIVD